MKDGYIVAVGAACMDEYYHADSWPEEGDKGMVMQMEPQIGGMISNAACVMAGYGNKVFLIDSMNNGPVSARLKENLESYHIDVSSVITDDSLADGKCIIVVTPKERTILVLDRGGFKRPLDPERFQLLQHASCVYTSIMEFRRFEEPEKLAGNLREAGVILAFDLEPSTFSDGNDPLFSMASLLFFNEAGLAKYAGGRAEMKCIEELLEAGVRCIVVTLGADGCDCYTSEEKVHLDGLKVAVKDTTGAGDTYNGSFVHAYLAGMPLIQCARFANAAAAHSVTQLGPKAGVRSTGEVMELVGKYYS